jgi:hypothetical protein
MLYAGVRVAQIFPGKVPIVVVVALHVLAPWDRPNTFVKSFFANVEPFRTNAAWIRHHT